jgi:hypothetical protein
MHYSMIKSSAKESKGEFLRGKERNNQPLFIVLGEGIVD